MRFFFSFYSIDRTMRERGSRSTRDGASSTGCSSSRNTRSRVRGHSRGSGSIGRCIAEALIEGTEGCHRQLAGRGLRMQRGIVEHPMIGVGAESVVRRCLSIVETIALA